VAHSQVHAQAQPQPAPQPQPQPQPRRAEFTLEGLEQELAIPQARPQQRPAAEQQSAARSAAQARPAGDPGVRIGPFRPDPSLITARPSEHDIERARANDAARAAAAANFVPPAAERPDSMQPRMPRVEDFPPVAQRQLRAQQTAPAHADEERGRPRGLLARLASGLTRRDDSQESNRRERDDPRVAQGQQLAPHPALTPAAEFKPQPRRMGEGAPAAGGLDTRGRPVPIDQRDDHLEIPAFLRRQSS